MKKILFFGTITWWIRKKAQSEEQVQRILKKVKATYLKNLKQTQEVSDRRIRNREPNASMAMSEDTRELK